MLIHGADTERTIRDPDPGLRDQQIDHQWRGDSAGTPIETSCDVPVPGRTRTGARARRAVRFRGRRRRPTR
ncbi:hypothetical protein [Kocuria nitroreducens]|uniref:hypothetical protein n=1 Tax=Kocuria nitroreducens TaxID=3058914 RepID=UPI0036DB7D8B